MAAEQEDTTKALGMEIDSLDAGLVVPGQSAVLSVDFHRAGEYLISASEDGAVQLINALEGKARKKVFCKKYGVEIARFTHHEQSILCTSRPIASSGGGGAAAASDTTVYDIRYLSLYDNQYMRFFTGHQGRVTGLSMSYTDDRFLSASVDGTIRLWTLQQPKSIGVGNIQYPTGHPTLVRFDPTGLVFAACGYVKERHLIKLYDARQFSQGAFETFSMTDYDLQQILTGFGIDAAMAWSLCKAQWVSLDFSPDGKYMLISTNAAMTLIIDAYELQIRRVIRGYTNPSQVEIIGCYSPDSNHLFTGSEDGDVCIYETKKDQRPLIEEPVRRLKGHTGAVRQVLCNPKYEVVASACHNTILWIPK